MKSAKICIADENIQFIPNAEKQVDTTWEKFVENDDILTLLTNISQAANHLQLQLLVNRFTAHVLDAELLQKEPAFAKIEYGVNENYVEEIVFLDSIENNPIKDAEHVINRISFREIGKEISAMMYEYIFHFQILLDNSNNDCLVIDPVIVAKYRK